ncbi:bile acid:sodium symporter family protein [Methylococcus sp. BF19-07]
MPSISDTTSLFIWNLVMHPKHHCVEKVAHICHRHFIWILITSYFMASLFPDFGIWIREVKLGSTTLLHGTLEFSVPSLMLSLLLFNAGLSIRTEDFKRLGRRPSVLLGGLCGNLVTPLAFLVGVSFIMSFWHNPEEAQDILVGLALIMSMPIAGASTAWTQNANGNLVLSLGLILLTTLLSPITSPLVLHTAGFVTSGDHSEDLHEFASNSVTTFLGVWVILPSLLGILMHRFVFKQSPAVAKSGIRLINYILLLLLNYSNASLTLPDALSHPDIDLIVIMLIIVILLCTLGFYTGYLIAKVFHLDRKDMASLMFGLGMNNNGAGLVLVSIAMADHSQVMLPILFYNLVQHFVASFVNSIAFRSGAESYQST